MYFVMGNRDNLIQQYPKGCVWAEIGVYRGDFSQKIFDTCQPSELRGHDLSIKEELL